MSEQLNIFKSRSNRDLGISQAADNAGEDWNELAYKFLLQYIRHNIEFMAEDIRAASRGTVPPPPSLRAWGAVIVRAKKCGLITSAGYGKVRNPKAHRTPATIWRTRDA